MALTEPLRKSEGVMYIDQSMKTWMAAERTTPTQTVTMSRDQRNIAKFRPTRVTMARCPRLSRRQSRLAE